MADEAFALSPIAARPVQPGEADYDAIKEAFMETSRGRWFLGEYAKRNRNADTKMVLDAVSRIEETIAASRKPVRDPLLDEALASLRAALTQAREAANVALDDLALEQNLAPVRKGARVIREIAWRLREIGADGRICDLIDSQVAAIEGAAAKLVPSNLAVALSGAFDRIEEKIAGFDADGGAASPSPPQAAAREPVPAASAQAEAQVGEPTEVGGTMQTSPIAPEAKTETAAANPAVSDESSMAVAAEAISEPAEPFDADDEAMLDMVAMEMAAPDTDAAYEPPMEEMSDSEMSDYQVPPAATPGARAPAAPASVAAKNSHVPIDDIKITFVTDAGQATAEPAVAAPTGAPIQVSPEAESAPSLGSSLLANGIVSRPRTSRPDPLAPIRRMSQNEKIAFFS
jgi:hypothetical protein